MNPRLLISLRIQQQSADTLHCMKFHIVHVLLQSVSAKLLRDTKYIEKGDFSHMEAFPVQLQNRALQQRFYNNIGVNIVSCCKVGKLKDLEPPNAFYIKLSIKINEFDIALEAGGTIGRLTTSQLPGLNLSLCSFSLWVSSQLPSFLLPPQKQPSWCNTPLCE